jgi:hypothetical protein
MFNLLLLDINKPTRPTYCQYVYHLVRYARACTQDQDICLRHELQVKRLMSQNYLFDDVR